MVDGGHRDSVALDQIDHAARSGHDEVDAPLEPLDLFLDRRAAVNGEGGTVDHLGGGRQFVAHLSGELTGRHEHESGWLLRLGLRHQLQHGQAKGKGLARTGLGLAADISAGECVGDGEGLDREGGGDPPLGQGAGDGIGQPQVRERLCFGHLFSGEPGSGKRGPPAGRVVVG